MRKIRGAEHGYMDGGRVRRISWYSALALGLPAAAITFGGARWPFELAYHFVVHLAVVTAAVAVVCLVLRHFLPALTMTLFALAYTGTAISVPGAVLDHRAEAAAGPEQGFPLGAPPGVPFDLISFNLLATQDETGTMLSWLSGAPADVLVLVESSPEWRRGFESLRGAYPYQALGLPLDRPEHSADPDLTRMSGVAILSRLPLRGARVFYPAGRIKPALAAEVLVGGAWTTVVAVHTTKPLTPRGLATRDRYLKGLSSVLAPVEGPLVIAGDFNATRYAPGFDSFRKALDLHGPRRHPATFPAGAGGLGIAIDHVLARDAKLGYVKPLAPRGSDHRGLLARVTVPAAP